MNSVPGLIDPSRKSPGRWHLTAAVGRAEKSDSTDRRAASSGADRIERENVVRVDGYCESTKGIQLSFQGIFCVPAVSGNRCALENLAGFFGRDGMKSH